MGKNNCIERPRKGLAKLMCKRIAKTKKQPASGTHRKQSRLTHTPHTEPQGLDSLCLVTSFHSMSSCHAAHPTSVGRSTDEARKNCTAQQVLKTTPRGVCVTRLGHKPTAAERRPPSKRGPTLSRRRFEWAKRRAHSPSIREILGGLVKTRSNLTSSGALLGNVRVAQDRVAHQLHSR